jgi:hypothetical protein
MYKLTTNHAHSDMPEIAPTRTELLLFGAVLAAAPLVLLGLVVSGLVT